MLHINKSVKNSTRLSAQIKKIPLCATCKFYQKGVCKNFVTVSLIDGKETEVLAVDARHNVEMCGPGGAYYKPTPTKPVS